MSRDSVHYTQTKPPDLRSHWISRLKALPEDPFGHPEHPDPQRIALVVYPEAVALTADYLAARLPGIRVNTQADTR